MGILKPTPQGREARRGQSEKRGQSQSLADIVG